MVAGGVWSLWPLQASKGWEVFNKSLESTLVVGMVRSRSSNPGTHEKHVKLLEDSMLVGVEEDNECVCLRRRTHI